jgi:hypothetical protein
MISFILFNTLTFLFLPVKSFQPICNVRRSLYQPLICFSKTKKRSNAKRPFILDTENEDETEEESTQIKNNNITLTKKSPSSKLRKELITEVNENASELTGLTTNSEWKNKVEKTIIEEVGKFNATLVKLNFIQNRIELTVTNGASYDESLVEMNAEKLSLLHRKIYEQFELQESAMDVVSRFEV